MMNKSKMNFMLGVLLSAGGALLAMEAYKMRQKEAVLEDTDMRNSKKIDREESVNEKQTRRKKGLHSWTPRTELNGSQMDSLRQGTRKNWKAMK